MYEYESLLDYVLHAGERREDRTNTGTISKFGVRRLYDLTNGFPLITTKRVWWKGVVAELCWFLKGDTNLAYLHEHDVHIWDAWADENGDLGPIYGHQWRNLAVDQIQYVLDELRTDPTSRRIVLDAWNIEQLDDMALPPCHVLCQFYVDANRRLHAQLYQRSADLFLGVPFNIASYSALTHLLAAHAGLTPGSFAHVIGDAHIYANHVDQVREQLSREPYPFPTLRIEHQDKLENYEPHHFTIEGYQCHPTIKAPMAV